MTRTTQSLPLPALRTSSPPPSPFPILLSVSISLTRAEPSATKPDPEALPWQDELEEELNRLELDLPPWFDALP